MLRPKNGNGEHRGIGEGGFPSVEQVEADAASVWVEHGRGNQMVEVDEIGCGDCKASKLPACPPDYRSDQKRSEPMPAIVQEWLEGFHRSPRLGFHPILEEAFVRRAQIGEGDI